MLIRVLLIGNVSQWGEVKKKTKDRSRSKVKDSTSGHPDGASGRGARGGRGGVESGRSGRGRGSDRARGPTRAGRGGVNGPTAGARSSGKENYGEKISVPTEESQAWNATAQT